MVVEGGSRWWDGRRGMIFQREVKRSPPFPQACPHFLPASPWKANLPYQVFYQQLTNNQKVRAPKKPPGQLLGTRESPSLHAS